MTKPTITDDILTVSVDYLLKKYKQDSGYKLAVKEMGDKYIHHDHFDPDAYICSTIEEISNKISKTPYSFPEVDHVHAAFYEAAPFMFKSKQNGEFIFDWIRKPYIQFLGYHEDCINTVCETIRRIRILKLILMHNPNACLKIKLEPKSE